MHMLTPTYWCLEDKHVTFKFPAVGLILFHVTLDVLHILDLGITQHVCAIIIYMLVFDTGVAGNVDSKMVPVYEALDRAYRSLGTPPGERLPYAMFTGMFNKSRTARPTLYPELHSKGAVGRHCAAAVRSVVRDMGDWAPASSCVTTFRVSTLCGS